jgi:hypothetical protein
MLRPLAPLNRALETGERALDEGAWREWLYDCDMHAPLSPKFNRAHLLGLLLARQKALHNPSDVRLCEALPHVVHASKRTCELTVRQLRDALEDLQMHWATHCASGDGVVDALDGLWSRFGAINLMPLASVDDLASVDPEAPDRMSNAAIRRFTVTFCVLFRHLDLESTCQHVEDDKDYDFDIQDYHRQAGLDSFYEHAIYADLPPASRITYKQDFAGMYHSITQVVYFHFPDYSRRRQISLEEIREGKKLLHCLSVALQLRPDMEVKMEDEQWGETCWVVLPGGKVYMMLDGSVLTSDSIWALLERALRRSA